MPTNALNTLIVRHLADIDGAAKHLYEVVEEQIGNAIGDVVKDWAKGLDLKGEFDYPDGVLWFGPAEWQVSDAKREEWYFYWEFGPGEDDSFEQPGEGKDFFWLTRLCGQGRGTLGFRLHCNYQFFQQGAKAWRSFMAEQAWRFRERGFNFEQGRGQLFLPVHVDPESLAKTFEESGQVVDALDPIVAALSTIYDARQSFDQLLSHAKQSLGVRAQS
ncbi:hypothetical protein [Emcibacter sp. SYSU 3D8]|uniref:hypothetical protein n=1 Tax=Emcibacter sp. SYSU 3D8 TaxID=3133969 RepID=UPI0031FF253C